jgi:hypothetical protein
VSSRSLSRTEAESYDHLSREVAVRARLRRSRLVPPGSAGITIGRTIRLRPGREDDPKLIAHELVHVRQYAEQGRVPFLVRYLAAYLRNLARLRRHRAAYLAIPAEVEARAEADRWLQTHRR